jgi:hypothetical protein
MFGGVGLAAVPGGYDEGAQSYWKRRELEDSQAALQLLGNYALTNIPGTLPGAGVSPSGGPVPGGPGALSPGGPGMANGGPGGPGMANGGPGVPPGAMPPRPMGMAAGPPGIIPGGPPPGFVNPLNAGGQPQNLTGPPIPPGGMGGAPGGGPGMPPQGMGVPPQQGPPPGAQQLVSRLGPPPAGGYDWRQVVREIAQANPKADPAVIARAAMMMMPLMNQNAQMELRMLNMYLAQERLTQGEQRMQLSQENMDLRRQHDTDTNALRTRQQDERDRENRERDQRGERSLDQRDRTFDQRTDRYRDLDAQAGRREDERERANRVREVDRGQNTDLRGRQQDERERENLERDLRGNKSLNLREQRYMTLAEQARQRLDQQSQRLLVDKEDKLQRAKDRAAALAQSGDAKARRDALLEWKNAMEDYHRSVRERIGAAGILDKKTRIAMDEELKQQEAADKAEMEEAAQRYKGMAPGARVTPQATPEEMSSARDQLRQGLQAQQPPAGGGVAPSPAAGPAGAQGALKPVPQEQLQQLQPLIQKYGRDRVMEELRKQGFDTQGL